LRHPVNFCSTSGRFDAVAADFDAAADIRGFPSETTSLLLFVIPSA